MHNSLALLEIRNKKFNVEIDLSTFYFSVKIIALVFQKLDCWCREVLSTLKQHVLGWNAPDSGSVKTIFLQQPGPATQMQCNEFFKQKDSVRVLGFFWNDIVSAEGKSRFPPKNLIFIFLLNRFPSHPGLLAAWVTWSGTGSRRRLSRPDAISAPSTCLTVRTGNDS